MNKMSLCSKQWQACTSGAHLCSQFVQQLVPLFLHLVLLLQQFVDGRHQSRHVGVLSLLLNIRRGFTAALRFVLLCGKSGLVS